MKRPTILITVFLGCVVAATAHAEFEIPWSTIDGGGGTSSGASLELFGTIGQPDAGVSGGDGLTLYGGFIAGGAAGTTGCTGDVNGDGSVDFADLLLVLQDWGSCSGCPGDVDGSGVVDFADLLLVLQDWGPCP